MIWRDCIDYWTNSEWIAAHATSPSDQNYVLKNSAGVISKMSRAGISIKDMGDFAGMIGFVVATRILDIIDKSPDPKMELPVLAGS
jgi:hypothetical protein